MVLMEAESFVLIDHKCLSGTRDEARDAARGFAGQACLCRRDRRGDREARRRLLRAPRRARMRGERHEAAIALIVIRCRRTAARRSRPRG